MVASRSAPGAAVFPVLIYQGGVVRCRRLKLHQCLAAALVLGSARPGNLPGQGTLVVDSVSSPGLASNLVGDGSVRRVLVYLPPSYRHDSARRYPVLYLLHGATSTPDEWLDGTYQGLNLSLTLDSLMAAPLNEFIVAMPDADNALHADWYANSPATGNWEDFVVQDLVRYIDRRYRTEARAASRALVGHSMGGFGALAIGFNHPGVYGLVYAVSPCCIGFVGPLAPSGPAWPALSAITRWQAAPERVGLFVGLAAALDGSRTNPRLFDELPFQWANGTIVPNPAAQARWLARMPPDLASAMVRRGDRAPVLHLEAGSEESGIREGVRVLRARLDSLGIRYSDTTFVGGHIDRVRERFTRYILPTVGRWFDLTRAAAPGPAPGRPRCGDFTPDSLWLRPGPVYQDCEVDRPAKRRGGDPQLDLDPVRLGSAPSCLRVALSYVVDTLGAVELAAVRTLASDHPDLEAAVRASLARLKYAPARKADRRVRQVVEYSRSVATPVDFAVRVINHPTDLLHTPPRPRFKRC